LQKRRKLGPERAKAVNDEVDLLLKIGSIREVKYPDWLANPVAVKKKNRKWRVCIDFTDLNKASHSRISTDWSKPPQDTNYCPSWTHSPGTTKYLCAQMTKKKQLLLPTEAPTVIK